MAMGTEVTYDVKTKKTTVRDVEFTPHNPKDESKPIDPDKLKAVLKAKGVIDKESDIE